MAGATNDTGIFLDEYAEQAALGAALENDSACSFVCAALSPDDFFSDRHRTIFVAIARLRAGGRGVDQVSVAAEFPVGEMRDLVHGLAETVPSIAHVAEYVAAVRGNSERRQFHRELQSAEEDLARCNGDGLAAARDRVRSLLERQHGGLTGAAAPRTAFVDWGAFWARDHSEAEWEFPDVLARGRGHAIYAAHKDGKSLFSLFVSVVLATGVEPVVVVYLDYEMTEADLSERLADMGCDARTDLSRLQYALLPTLPPLDTLAGSDALMALLDRVQGQWPDHRIVCIVDTIGRAVCGEENSADTIRDFYNLTGIKLKRRGVTWLRVDHAGMDPAKGQRGTSAKGDDVDVVWRLRQTENGVQLERKLARMSWVPERVTFKITDDPLAFVRLTEDWPAGTAEVANMLDRLEVPLSASTRAAAAALKTIDEGRRRQLVVAALRFRHNRHEEGF